MANKDPLLSFDEFELRQNNFALHFAGHPGKHMMGDLYRKGPAFQACLASSDKFRSLASELYGFEARGERGEALFEQKLYQAYVLMHLYADENWDIFK